MASTVAAQDAAVGPPDQITGQPYADANPAPSKGPLFEALTSAETGVEFQMQLPDAREHIREFVLLAVYGGICTGDYDGDGLPDFYVTSPEGGNRLFKNLGGFRFRDVTVEAGVHDPDLQGSGATFVDVDNDGDLDIYACAYGGPNRLFINEGPDADGLVLFSEQAARFGLAYNGASMTTAFADMDNDGDLDAYLATTAKQPPPGIKFQVRFEGDVPIVLDELREYWELIYLPGNRVRPTEAGQFDHLYRNDRGRFTDVSREAGIDGPHFTLSATWWDYNGDNRPDLYVANDFFGPDHLYRNDGGGRFTDVAADILPHTPWFSMGTDVADVNNDGLVDLLGTDMSPRSHARRMVMSGSLTGRNVLETMTPRQESRNVLYLNSGESRMYEAARQFRIDSTDWTWTPRLADFDNDGFVDLFVTTGVLRDSQNSDYSRLAAASVAPGSEAWRNFWANKPMRKENNLAFRNLAGRAFEEVSAAWGLDRLGVSFGAATADFDNDGDLDIVVNNADVPVSIYRNQSAGSQSIRVRLRGKISNPYGVGATIVLQTGGRRQAQYLTLARGWLSAIEPVLHFGLGDARQVAALTVTWPSGYVQKFTALPSGRIYTITEPEDAPPANARPTVGSRADQRKMFDRQSQLPPIEFDEEPYDDFADQPLLPYRLSKPGPAVACSDVDGDGDQDVFLGGSRGQAGRLLINVGQGQLQVAAVPAFAVDLRSDAAAACFFDADGDGDADLFVASGSVERPAGDGAYLDALYLNDGRGDFTRAPADALPQLADSGSVVTPADFDRDGDLDLFVGSRSVPGRYPMPPENRLLVNDGGKFRDAAPDSLKNAGMTTDAVWVDVDSDTWLDLVVTTDWGPVRLYHNEQGQLVERTDEAGLADRLGWWLAVAPGDFNGDGRVDLVVTNFGRNTPYRPSPEAPVLLHYGDFEELGRPQIIEGFFEKGVCYPRREFLTLARVMPTLEVKYDTFEKFSVASIEDILGADRLKQALRLEATELDSGLLYNEGNLRFRFEPLPDRAQLSPAFGVDVADIDGDQRDDLVLAQNFFGANGEVGRLDGGVGLVILGRPGGQLEPLPPTRSGVIVPEEARCVKAIDLDGDGRRDLVFGVHGELAIYHNNADR